MRFYIAQKRKLVLLRAQRIFKIKMHPEFEMHILIEPVSTLYAEQQQHAIELK